MESKKIKTVSYNKMSKNAKSELNRKARATWNGINPVTKIVTPKNIYKRKKKHSEDDGYSD